MGKYKLRVTIDEIEGDCAVHKEGDEFMIDSDGQTLRPEGTDKICLYALNGITSTVPAFTKELPDEDWMSEKIHKLQCIDPGVERGGAGTVYMKIERLEV